MKFEVDENLVAPIIRDQIAAAVVTQLGNTDELIRRMVHLALTVKTQSDGTISKYSSDNRYDFVEAISAKAIREAAQSAVQKIVEDQKPAIQAAIEAELKRAPKKTAAAIIDGFVEGAKHPYKLTCNFQFSPNN
jgi:hypothetical protein